MNDFVGTARLARFIVRQDRLRLAAWIIALPMLAVGTAKAYDGLYPTAADRQNLDLQFGSNKAIAIVTGPVHGLGTAGGFTEWRLGGSLATLTALMAIFLVIRHTRADEQTGRADLITASKVGRLAPLSAAIAVTSLACLAIGGVIAVGMTTVGTALPGSLAMGLATTLAGIVFASIAAVTAQLSTYARTASALAGAALGASFLLRGIGDSTDSFSWLSWLSPIGWAQQVRPYNGERWWVLALSVALIGATVALAARLQLRRDVGAGLIEPKPGPATAAAGFGSAGALAWRQHRASAIAWLVGGIVWSLLFGSLANAVADIAASSPQIQVILERMGGSKVLTQTFIGTAVGMIAMIVAFYIAGALTRARDEETSGRAELLLATPVDRLSWLTGHVVAAYAGIAAIMLSCGLALGLAASLASPDVQFARVVGSAAAHIPALWIVAGVCLMFYGWLPQRSSLMWVVVGAALAISMFGQMLNAPNWILKISPFTSAPIVTDAAFAWGTLLLQLAIAIALLALGYLGVRRRDLPS